MEIFFVAAVILVLAVASFLFFRVKTNESASLDEVKNTFYRNLPIGAIYSSVLSDAEWNVGRNGVVSVEENVVYGNHLATLTASYDTASTVVLRSLMIDGSLVSIDSVSAVMDRFYDMAYSSRR